MLNEMELKNKYCKLILEQVKKEKDIEDSRLKNIESKLRSSNSSDLERLYQAFERFRVNNIINSL